MNEIQTKLNNIKIVVLRLSFYFLKTKYVNIYSTELTIYS